MQDDSLGDEGNPLNEQTDVLIDSVNAACGYFLYFLDVCQLGNDNGPFESLVIYLLVELGPIYVLVDLQILLGVYSPDTVLDDVVHHYLQLLILHLPVVLIQPQLQKHLLN